MGRFVVVVSEATLFLMERLDVFAQSQPYIGFREEQSSTYDKSVPEMMMKSEGSGRV